MVAVLVWQLLVIALNLSFRLRCKIPPDAEEGFLQAPRGWIGKHRVRKMP